MQRERRSEIAVTLFGLEWNGGAREVDWGGGWHDGHARDQHEEGTIGEQHAIGLVFATSSSVRQQRLLDGRSRTGFLLPTFIVR